MPMRLTDFSLKPQEREFFFTVNEKTKYKIPSKMFPLARKKDAIALFPEYTVPFHHEEFFRLLNQQSFPIGKCYGNSDVIEKIGKHLHLDIHFFSGWLFRGPYMPIHHAWNVIRHKDGSLSVIDYYPEVLMKKAEEAVRALNIQDKTEQRIAFADCVKQAEKEYPLNTQRMIIGQIPSGYMYVGSRDTPDNARLIFQNFSKKFPAHPSYQGGNNLNGRSELQKIMKEKGINVL